MKRTFRTLVMAVLALALLVPVASADQTTLNLIINQARTGVVSQNFTAAALRGALASPLLREYSGPGGVDAVQAALGDQSKTTTTVASGTLPFTGAELITFVIIGGTLLAAGFILRRSGRRDDAA
jgi:hypothetical protein